MKILQINSVHYRRGGADVVYLNTGKLLEDHGHEVCYFSMKDSKTPEYTYDNYFPVAIDYRKISLLAKIKSVSKFLYNKEAYIKLNEYIKKVKPDIAHIHLFMGGLTVSILKALKENDIPIVHTVHDYRLICPAYTFLDKNNNICEKCKDGFYLRCAFNKCSLENKYTDSTMLSMDAYFRKYLFNPIDLIDKFIFVSNFSKRLHERFNNKFVNKSVHLYNFKSDTDDNIKNRNNIKGDYFLFFGRLSREKGVELLIEAVNELNIKLKIVGNGPLYPLLKKKSNNNIELLGYKSGDELVNLIRNTSFVIVPSEWYENNPLTIIEAYSFGKPVIGSKIGGITELIRDSNGFLFEPKNAESLKLTIKKANNISSEDYFKMSQNARKFAHENFSKEIHYKKLISIYKSVINDKKNN